MPGRSANAAAGSTTSAWSDRGVGEAGRPRRRTRRRPAPRRGQLAVGEVGQRVGAEQHKRLDLALGRGGQDAERRRGRAPRAPCPRPRRTRPGRRRATPGRAARPERGPCRARRARCPGAAPGGTRTPAKPAARTAGGFGHRGRRLGERGPAEDHHDPGRFDERRGAAVDGRDRHRRRIVAGGPGHERVRHRGDLAGPVAERGRGVSRAVRCTRAPARRACTPCSTAAARSRR